MTTTKVAPRGFIQVWAHPNVKSFNCQFGEYFVEEDGTCFMLAAAVPIAESHGFFRSKEALEMALRREQQKLDDERKKNELPPLRPEGQSAPVTERIIERVVYRDAPAAAAPSMEERVAKQDRFALREYCEGEGIEIPPRTATEELRKMVLAHMKVGAEGKRPGTDAVEKVDEPNNEPKASTK